MFRALARRKASPLTPEEREIVSRPWINTFPKITEWKSEQSEEDKLKQSERIFLYRTIRDAIARSVPKPRGLYLATSDAFYTVYALGLGVTQLDVYDVGAHIPGHEHWHFEQTRVVAKVRGIDDAVTFTEAPLESISGRWDFCICTDVIENYPDPEAAFSKIREIVPGPMAFFSLCRYPNTPDFLEVRPPERPWGCRISHDMMIKCAVAAGWTIVNEGRQPISKDLPGDRDLCFLHCV